MNNYIISEKVANEIIAYLTKRPYEEVVTLINQLIQLQLVTVIPPETKGGVDNGIQSTTAQGQESNGGQETKQESSGEK